MTRYYYKKSKPKNKRKILRVTGLILFFIGISTCTSMFLPMILYQLSNASVFASEEINAPVPKIALVDARDPRNPLLSENTNNGDDALINASNWFPAFKTQLSQIIPPKISSYSVAIPDIGIMHAVVTTADDDLTRHLVNYQDTAIPPNRGTAVVFGHSTLPYLFDQSNYRTIFANVYKLQVGNHIQVTVEGKKYTYEVFSMTVVDPSDTSVFAQNYDTSFINFVTCVPPGTTDKRLVIQSRLID